MKKTIAVLCLAVFCLNLACFKNDNREDKAAMNRIIPPADTLKIDFSSLQSINAARAGTCHGTALALVAWANLLCVAPFAVPVAIFAILQTQIPTAVSENHVEWRYAYNDNSIMITADKRGGDFDWEWAVIINGFTWISGGSRENKQAGFWVFHDSRYGIATDSVFRVDWTRADDTHAQIKFLNVNDNDTAVKGDFIEYTRTGDDLTIQFHDMHSSLNSNNLLDITVYWNSVTKLGGITNNVGPYSDCTWNPAH